MRITEIRQQGEPVVRLREPILRRISVEVMRSRFASPAPPREVLAMVLLDRPTAVALATALLDWAMAGEIPE